MIRTLPWFRWIRLLSLDIALGASATSYFACRLFETKLPFLFWPVQFLVVLVIYLTDHLADSHFVFKPEPYGRYSIYKQYQKLLFRLIIFLFVSLFILVFFLSHELWLYGSIGSIFVGFYLVLNQWQNRKKKYIFPRELIIALFYLYGTWGFPVFLASKTLGIEELLLLIAYYFLVLSNVLIYSYYDFTLDKSQQIMTFAVRFGVEKCKQVVYMALLLSFLLFLGSMLLNRTMFPFCLIGLFISFFYYIVIMYSKWFSLKGRYGIAIDLAFLLPVILYLIK